MVAESSGKNKFPAPTVKYAEAGNPNPPTVEEIKGIICNPIYAGVGPFPPIVDDEQWVGAAKKQIEEDGEEQFLINMLFVLRRAFRSDEQSC